MASTPDRQTPHSGSTARENRDSIKIVYDAELKDLPLCQQISLLCACCSIYDKERSYLYLRENSMESNVVIAPCCGYCTDLDFIDVTYFDRPPFAKQCRTGPCPFCCCLFTCDQPKVELVDNSCLCFFQQVDPCCCGKQVVLMPFETFPIPCCCCVNRVGWCDNCCGCCGPITGNPKIFSPFRPQPLDAVAFVAAVQRKMLGTVSENVQNALMRSMEK